MIFLLNFRSVLLIFFRFAMGKRNKPSEKSLQSREQCTHGPVTHNDKSAALLDDDEQVKKTKRSKIQHYFGKPEVQTSALLSATKSITHYLPATIAKSVQPQIPSLQLPSISAATDLRLVKSSILLDPKVCVHVSVSTCMCYCVCFCVCMFGIMVLILSEHKTYFGYCCARPRC